MNQIVDVARRSLTARINKSYVKASTVEETIFEKFEEKQTWEQLGSHQSVQNKINNGNELK